MPVRAVDDDDDDSSKILDCANSEKRSSCAPSFVEFVLQYSGVTHRSPNLDQLTRSVLEVCRIPN